MADKETQAWAPGRGHGSRGRGGDGFPVAPTGRPAADSSFAEAGPRPETLLAMDARAFSMQFSRSVRAKLSSVATLGVPVVTESFDQPEVVDRLADVEVLLTSWGCPAITPAVLARAPRLRAVLHAAGSVRAHVPIEVLEAGILVTTAASANAVPVAEFTVAMIVACGKRVPFLARDARRFRSDLSYVTKRGPLSNHGRTVCIVGWSRVGRLVGRMLQPYDMEVLVVDPYADAEVVRRAGATLTTADDAFPRCDVLTLHAPMLPSTRHMIDAPALARLADGATLINTARGGLVDTEALTRECVGGRLYAVLDVTDPEPLPDDSPLYNCDNVVITPHIAGSLDSETERMSLYAIDELDRYRRGLPPKFPLTLATYETSA